MLFTGTTVHVAKAILSLYSQHQLFAPTSALDSCLASHGYKHLLRLFSWLLPIHSHFKSHLFSWESSLGQDDYGTHGSGYHSFLVLATEVGKYMPSPLLFASQSGSSHSLLWHSRPCRESKQPKWGHPPLRLWSRENYVQTPILFATVDTSENWDPDGLSHLPIMQPDQWQSSFTPSRRTQLSASHCLLLPYI